MSGARYLAACRKMMDISYEGIKKCLEIQKELNEDYAKGSISYWKWKAETAKIDRKIAWFKERFDDAANSMDDVKNID